MNARITPQRRRSSRRVSPRCVQCGTAARGLIVVTGLVGAIALQLAGPRLQCRLADLVGAPSAPPAAAPASMPSCGTPSSEADPMHPCKVATMASAAPIFAPGL